VTGLGHQIQDFSLPKVRDAGAWRYLLSYATALRTLRRTVVDEQIDVIHAFVAFTIKVVIPVAMITSTPALVSVHEMTTAQSIGRLRSLLQRSLVTRAAVRITAVSQYVATALCSMGYPQERVTVIYNGIARSTPRTERHAARACLEIPEQPLVFLVPGRLTRWKGQLVAVEAFDQFCAGHPGLDAQLLVVGEPFAESDRAYEAELRQKIAATARPALIHMYGYRSDIELFYDAADVVLVPSIEPEPLGMVVLEAGLAERPVIVTDLGGPPETVLDGITGLVTSPTADRFASAMTRSTDAAWRDAAGRAASHHVEQHFSRPHFATQMFAEWSKTAQGRRPGGRQHSE
jgi:glycosyltransferase involved in cell wall biosynthesis